MKKFLVSIFLIVLINTAPHALADEALLLYGGEGHRKYVGCLNCSEYEQDSVCNKYAQYGSKYSSESIWNKYGTYGSKYNSSSPWNKYGSNGLKVVSDSGSYYGIMSANRYIFGASRNSLVSQIVAAYNEIEDTEVLRDLLCE